MKLSTYFRLFALIVFAFALPNVRAQELSADLRARIDTALSVPMLKNTTVGFLVRDPSDGHTLYARNPDLALLPASNQKILTSLTILRRLGIGYRYPTTILRTGTITGDGTLRGDLYLRGSGDPSLDSARLLAMANTLKTGGIRRIDGHIYADASRFDNQYLGDGWTWDDEPYYYSAQVAGLNCDENVIGLDVQPGAHIGDPARVRLGGTDTLRLGFVGSSYFRIVSTVTTVAADGKRDVQFIRARAQNELRISGTMPLSGKVASDALTVENPPLFAATRLYELLNLVGVRFDGSNTNRIALRTTPTDAILVTETQSAPLGELIGHFLKVSDNLYGECFLKTAGIGTDTQMGTTEKGIASVADLLREWNIERGGWHMADGSGLSRSDNVTPHLLTDLLIAAPQKLPHDVYMVWENALPNSGTDGTLRGRFKDSAAVGKIRAKTGSLSGVAALSGYIDTKSGKRLVFSMILNNYDRAHGTEARAAMDAAILVLLDVPR